MKLPYLPFYVGDWRKDVGVQSLSYYHRGIWLELLLLMFESEIRGKLLVRGRPMAHVPLSRLLGITENELNDAISVLTDAGVASFCPRTQALMCRRMVRDERIRNANRARQKRWRNAHVTPNITPPSQTRARGGTRAETENEIEDVQNIKEKEDSKGKGQPISEDEVLQYSREQGLPETDGHYFWNHWQGNGFTNDGKKIKDWRATIRSWKHAGHCPSQKPQRTTTNGYYRPPASPRKIDIEYEQAQQRKKERQATTSGSDQ